jgi:molybdate transport system substrate-binding protein
VVIAAADANHVGTLEDLAVSGERVAIADPELAPAGQFARSALESAGVWDEFAGNLIFTSDVRAALAAVESGNATYGIVYRTDAFGSDSVSILSEIFDGYPQIVYVGRSLKNSGKSDEASSYFEFIANSAEVKKLFESAGFTVGFSD